MRLEIFQTSNVGARPNQEDSCEVVAMTGTRGQFLFLADGAGGANAGEVASQAVIDTAVAMSKRFRPGQDDLIEHLVNVAGKANDAVRDAIDKDEDNRKGMATTFIGAGLLRGELSWVSVGDSHLYVLRGGELIKLNEEHTLAAQLVALGEFKKDEQQPQSNYNALVSALDGRGVIEIIDICDKPFALRNDDLIITASDGLDTLGRSDIAKLLDGTKDEPVAKLTEKLVDAVIAVDKPRQDNVTVQMARVAGLPQTRSAQLPGTDEHSSKSEPIETEKPVDAGRKEPVAEKMPEPVSSVADDVSKPFYRRPAFLVAATVALLIAGFAANAVFNSSGPYSTFADRYERSYASPYSQDCSGLRKLVGRCKDGGYRSPEWH